MRSYLIFLAFFLFSFTLAAQSRVVEIEFDEVPGASIYEFEIRVLGQENLLKALSQKSPIVEVELPYNHYEFRQRTRDHRKVPGAWSSWEKITVTIPELRITKPEIKAHYSSEGSDTKDVLLEWSGAEGIKAYDVIIRDALSSEILKKQKVVDAQVATLRLPVATKYSVEVQTIVPEGAPEELKQTAQTEFTISAGALKAPRIAPVKNRFAREITWSGDDSIQSYILVLERLDPQGKKWSRIYYSPSFKERKLDFDDRWPAGTYRLMVRGVADLRKQSDVIEETFELAPVRTPAAEYNSSVTKAIDRIDGLYTQISWLMTKFKFESYSQENKTGSRAQPQGGTLRAGLGYMKSGSDVGYTAYLNSHHFIVNGEDRDFLSFEGNVLYRHRFSYRDELRISAGVASKELPILTGDTGSSRSDFDRAHLVGPRMGLEYWYSLGPKLGVQASMSQSFYSIFHNRAAPNGEKLHVPTAFQAGVMMSYKFTPTVTVLIGYSKLEERYNYQATRRGFPSPIIDGMKNDGALKADYIGLMVEMGL